MRLSQIESNWLNGRWLDHTENDEKIRNEISRNVWKQTVYFVGSAYYKHTADLWYTQNWLQS